MRRADFFFRLTLSNGGNLNVSYSGGSNYGVVNDGAISLASGSGLVINNNGVFANYNTLSMTGGAYSDIEGSGTGSNSALTNYGTVTLGDNENIYGSGSILNQSQMTFGSYDQLYLANSVFETRGPVSFGANNTVTVYSFINSDTISLGQSSTLIAGSFDSSGTINANANVIFNFQSAQYPSNTGQLNLGVNDQLGSPNGTFTNGGTITAQAGDNVTFGFLENGGTLNMAAASSVNAGSLDNHGTLNLDLGSGFSVSSVLNEGLINAHLNSIETSGTFENYGTLNLIAGAGLATNGAFENGGEVELTDTTLSIDGDTLGGTLSADSDSTVINTGTLNLSTAITSGYLVLASGATLDNQGTLETDANVSLQGVNLENEGSLNVNSGTLSVSGSIVESSGTATIASGAELDLDDGTTDGEYDFSAVTNSGIFHVLGGTAIVSELTGTGNTLVDAGATLIVPPAAPTDLSATVASSTEIDLSWNGVTSSFSTGYVIYESTDGTGYDPIDEVTTDTTSYQATDLTPGSGYWFKVTTDGEGGESAASNWVHQATTFLPPTINVTGDDTVTEGQPYELQLSADYADGEPGAISGWTVSWGDGSTNSTFSTATVDTTHTFASAVDSPTISITAIDSQGSYTASQDVSVIPAAPTGLTVAANGSNEIDLSWTNHSAFSDGTIILMSTDGESYFQLDEAPAGATTYAATGLSPDAIYSFEVEADSPPSPSAPSASVTQSLGYVAPTFTVTPQSPATENQALTLDLSSSYADNVSSGDVIDHWLVDWGISGLGVQTYTGSSLVASAPEYFASGASSAAVKVTAVDTSGRTFNAWDQTVQIAPLAPSQPGVSYGSGNTSATVNWSDGSSIATAYEVQRCDGGGDWTTVGTVDAVSGQSSYSFTDSTLSAGVNGSGGGSIYRIVAGVSGGASSAASSSNTAYYGGNSNLTFGTAYENYYGHEQGMPDVTGSLSPAAFTLSSDGVNYIPVNFASGTAVTFTVNGLSPHMWYNFGAWIDTNSGVQTDDSWTLTGPHNSQTTFTQGATGGGFCQPGMNTLDDNNDRSGTFTIQMNLPGLTSDGQPRTWSLEYVIVNIGNMDVGSGVGLRLSGGEGSDGFPNAPGASAIAVGGVDYKPVRLNHDYEGAGIDETINLIGYDSSLIEPLALSEKADAGGWAYFPIKAISAAATGSTAQLTFADNIGDQDVVAVLTCLPSVDASGSVTDGDPSASGGFVFSLPGGPSTVVVTVPFSTAGSTADSTDYLGLPSDGSVTIPAGDTSVYVPITAFQDNLIKAPLYLDVLGDPGVAGQGVHPAALVINDTNSPKVTIGGNTTGASFPLDTEGDPTKLVAVTLSAPTRGGDGVTYWLSWSPEINIWDHKPSASELSAGYDYDSYMMRFDGKLPSTVYAQAINGSQHVNSTEITLEAGVSVQPTATAPAAQASPTGSAFGTARGILIYGARGDVTNRSDGNFLVGQGINLEVAFVGPGLPLTQQWNISGNLPTCTGISTKNIPIPVQSTDLLSPTLHFYWLSCPISNDGLPQVVNVSLVAALPDHLYTTDETYTASVTINLFSPAWSGYGLILGGIGQQITGGGYGVSYVAQANVTTPDGFGTGTEAVAQVIDDFNAISGWHHVHITNATDAQFLYDNTEQPADGQDHEVVSDVPQLDPPNNGSIDATASYHFSDYLLFKPSGSDSIYVPLAINHWKFYTHIKDQDGRWIVEPDSHKSKIDDMIFTPYRNYPKQTDSTQRPPKDDD